MSKNANVYELSCRYDSRQSFYGKAQVLCENGKETLLSYSTPVCVIENGKAKLLDCWNESQTTLRHVKEFLKQNGLKAESKEQIGSDYTKI